MGKFKDFCKLLEEEKVIKRGGDNFLWVYHRTSDLVEFSDVWEDGLKMSNDDVRHGKGFYGTYEWNRLYLYGKFILRGYVDISNFAIFDRDIYDQLGGSHDDGSSEFTEHVKRELNYDGDLENAYEWLYTNHQALQESGYDGAVFKDWGRDKVIVVWENGKDKYKPHSYIESEDHLPTGGVKLKRDNKTYIGDITNDSSDVGNLGDVEVVDGNIELESSMLKDLGQIREVTGFLGLRGVTGLKKFIKLKKVGGLDIRDGSLESLGSLEEVNGMLFLQYADKLKDLGNLKKVTGKIFYLKSSYVERLLKERGFL